jgi:hypothetical protein
MYKANNLVTMPTIKMFFFKAASAITTVALLFLVLSNFQSGFVFAEGSTPVKTSNACEAVQITKGMSLSGYFNSARECYGQYGYTDALNSCTQTCNGKVGCICPSNCKQTIVDTGETCGGIGTTGQCTSPNYCAATIECESGTTTGTCGSGQVCCKGGTGSGGTNNCSVSGAAQCLGTTRYICQTNSFGKVWTPSGSCTESLCSGKTLIVCKDTETRVCDNGTYKCQSVTTPSNGTHLPSGGGGSDCSGAPGAVCGADWNTGSTDLKCDGRCCTATRAGYAIKVHTCSGPLNNRKCFDETPEIKNGTYCIPENFCGSMQIDLITTSNNREAGEGYKSANGNGQCGETQTSTPPGGSTPPASNPPQGPVCLNLSISKPNPKVGDAVTFTCGTVAGATKYEFRVKLPDGTIQTLPTASANTSTSFTIASQGAYAAQCRICTGANGTSCQQFEGF